jgi:hypothetical protein
LMLGLMTLTAFAAILLQVCRAGAGLSGAALWERIYCGPQRFESSRRYLRLW